MSNDLLNLLSLVRGMCGSEGVIIRFDDGMMVKVKADEYVRMHRALDDVRSDRAIINLGLREELDDVLPLIPEEDRPRVDSVFKDFMAKMVAKHIEIAELTKIIDRDYTLKDECIFENVGAIDKKRLALEFVPTLKDRRLAQFVFAYADEKDLWALLMKGALGSVGNGPKFDDFVAWLG